MPVQSDVRPPSLRRALTFYTRSNLGTGVRRLLRVDVFAFNERELPIVTASLLNVEFALEPAVPEAGFLFLPDHELTFDFRFAPGHPDADRGAPYRAFISFGTPAFSKWALTLRRSF